jgi:hypothetical protein
MSTNFSFLSTFGILLLEDFLGRGSPLLYLLLNSCSFVNPNSCVIFRIEYYLLEIYTIFVLNELKRTETLLECVASLLFIYFNDAISKLKLLAASNNIFSD